MSKERCLAVKQLMKQALNIIDSGAAGQGRGISLAKTYTEDAVLRVDFHMREMGWIIDATPSVNGEQYVVPRVNNLAPAAPIPQLNTGLMQPPVAPATPVKTRGRPPKNSSSDIDLL